MSTTLSPRGQCGRTVRAYMLRATNTINCPDELPPAQRVEFG